MPRLNYMKRLSRWRHTVKDVPHSAVYEDICELGVFQNYRTRCARAVISKNASITNIFIPASFGNTYTTANTVIALDYNADNAQTNADNF